MPDLVRRQARRAVALLVVVPLYFAARLPSPSSAERGALAAPFRFTSVQLDHFAELRRKSDVRPVHPSLAHIGGWISVLGGAIALHDLDGDGLSNDLCYVDTQSDLVVVAPAPGTGERYAAFRLDPAPLRYDGATMAPMGALPGDFDEDGRADLLVYYWGRAPVVFRNARAPEASLAREAYVAEELVPGELDDPGDPGGPPRWFTNAVTSADFDGDGHFDLFVGNYFADGARILDASAAGTEEMQDSMSRAYNGGRNRFLLWKAGRFVEADCGLPDALQRTWILAVGAADLDGDLLPEVYLANDFGPDELLHNRSAPGALRFQPVKGRKRLSTPNSKVLGRDSFKGMGVDFADLNGDGLLDVLVSNIATEFGLEESHFAFVSTGELELFRRGGAPYVDASEALGLSRDGWGWDVRAADFDGDGSQEVVRATGFLRGSTNRWPELHEVAMGNDQLLRHPGAWHAFAPGDDLSGHDPNPFYVRAADGRFYDLAREVGLGAPTMTRGLAVADVDGDLDPDLALGNQWEPPRFLRNDAAGANERLVLYLVLPVGAGGPDGDARAAEVRVSPGPPAGLRARPAVGAVARVTLPDGRRRVAQVDGGSGHSGVSGPELHFGLGPRDGAGARSCAVALQWRDGAGRVHAAEVALGPGAHTLLLGAREFER
jgi:hypothetical protein